MSGSVAYSAIWVDLEEPILLQRSQLTRSYTRARSESWPVATENPLSARSWICQEGWSDFISVTLSAKTRALIII